MSGAAALAAPSPWDIHVGTANMIKLTTLTEASIMANLKLRYTPQRKGGRFTIYTYVGSILVAVNPYRQMPIYDFGFVRRYRGKGMGMLPPHIFAVADAAFTTMMTEHNSKCCIISGESGAGKTENAKQFVRYLACRRNAERAHAAGPDYVDQAVSAIEQQVISTDIILETFGCAHTSRNDNSSRFGKYLNLCFSALGDVCSATIDTYMLELSRVVKHASKERNYHIFHMLLAGATASEKEALYLQDVKHGFVFLMANGGREKMVPPKPTDAPSMRLLRTALTTLLFTAAEQASVLSVVAGLLHFGDLKFVVAVANHMEMTELADTPAFAKTLRLFGFTKQNLSNALTKRTTYTRGEVVTTSLNLNSAKTSRDTLAKEMYARLFRYLVGKINVALSGDLDSVREWRSIGVLDIYGFEVFQKNSFEQLCINFWNEHLQQYFVKYIFKMETALYDEEGVDWSGIKFTDNQQTLDMLSEKPLNVFALVDDVSKRYDLDDTNLAEQLFAAHKDHPDFFKPRLVADGWFGIRHFAGEVEYTIDGFVRKNRDTFTADLHRAVASSESDFVVSMYPPLPSDDGSARRKRTTSLAKQFTGSLKGLLGRLNQCGPFFVRCIKPNEKKKPNCIDPPMVLRQLKYCGVLATIEIRHCGFPVQRTYEDFLHHFHILAPSCVADYAALSAAGALPGARRQAEIICKFYLGDRGGYAFGKTKVFTKDAQDEIMEAARAEKLKSTVVYLQRMLRGALCRWDLRKRKLAMRTVRVWLIRAAARRRYFEAYGELYVDPEEEARKLAKIAAERKAAYEALAAKRRELELKRQQLVEQRRLARRGPDYGAMPRREWTMLGMGEPIQRTRANAADAEEVFGFGEDLEETDVDAMLGFDYVVRHMRPMLPFDMSTALSASKISGRTVDDLEFEFGTVTELTAGYSEGAELHSILDDYGIAEGLVAGRRELPWNGIWQTETKVILLMPSLEEVGHMLPPIMQSVEVDGYKIMHDASTKVSPSVTVVNMLVSKVEYDPAAEQRMVQVLEIAQWDPDTFEQDIIDMMVAGMQAHFACNSGVTMVFDNPRSRRKAGRPSTGAMLLAWICTKSALDTGYIDVARTLLLLRAQDKTLVRDLEDYTLVYSTLRRLLLGIPGIDEAHLSTSQKVAKLFLRTCHATIKSKRGSLKAAAAAAAATVSDDAPESCVPGDIAANLGDAEPWRGHRGSDGALGSPGPLDLNASGPPLAEPGSGEAAYMPVVPVDIGKQQLQGAGESVYLPVVPVNVGFQTPFDAKFDPDDPNAFFRGPGAVQPAAGTEPEYATVDYAAVNLPSASGHPLRRSPTRLRFAEEVTLIGGEGSDDDGAIVEEAGPSNGLGAPTFSLVKHHDAGEEPIFGAVVPTIPPDPNEEEAGPIYAALPPPAFTVGDSDSDDGGVSGYALAGYKPPDYSTIQPGGSPPSITLEQAPNADVASPQLPLRNTGSQSPQRPLNGRRPSTQPLSAVAFPLPPWNSSGTQLESTSPERSGLWPAPDEASDEILLFPRAADSPANVSAVQFPGQPPRSRRVPAPRRSYSMGQHGVIAPAPNTGPAGAGVGSFFYAGSHSMMQGAHAASAVGDPGARGFVYAMQPGELPTGQPPGTHKNVFGYGGQSHGAMPGNVGVLPGRTMTVAPPGPTQPLSPESPGEPDGKVYWV